MSLLEEIRNGAIDGRSDLSGVLRKCMVLAYKLGHEPFRDWVNRELDGYEDHATLPDYRITPVTIKINAANIAWKITGQTIPKEEFPPELQSAASTGYIMAGVPELEALKDKDDLHFSLPPHVYYWLVENGDPDFALMGAYQQIPPKTITGVLGSIRNRLVEFTLSIEAEYPNIDQVAVGSSPISADRVSQIFQVTIMGHGHAINLGSGTSFVQNIAQQVIANDISSLRQFLGSQGVEQEDLQELEEVIVEANVVDLNDEKSRLRRWVDRVADKASKGATDLAKTATREAVLLSIRYYFGELTN